MTFTFTIPENEKNRIIFDYDDDVREECDTRIEDGKPVLFVNREGMITLAKVLLRMAHGTYTDGFHVHLRKDFNADEPEVLTIILSTRTCASAVHWERADRETGWSFDTAVLLLRNDGSHPRIGSRSRSSAGNPEELAAFIRASAELEQAPQTGP